MAEKIRNYGIKEGYSIRKNNNYYIDDTGTTTWQPDVYTAAVELARKCGAEIIIDIGSGNGEKLMPYKREFKFIFVDFGSNLKLIEKNIGKKGNQFIDQNFEKGFPKFSEEILKKSVVVCSDVIEHIVKPDILVDNLVLLSNLAPFVVISTIDRARTWGVKHFGPSANKTHVREWSMEELDTLFRSHGMSNHFTGITRSNDFEQARRTIAIVAGTYPNDLAKKPKTHIVLKVNYPNKQAAADYYWAEHVTLVSDSSAYNFKLMPGEWLAAPNTNFTVGSLLFDAMKKDYTAVAAQVIEIDPSPTYSWPQAGIIRHGHGLIGELKEVRIIPLRPGKNKENKIYPIQLSIFREKSRKKVKRVLSSRLSLQSTRLIDTGHLDDDFMLETLVGWHILNDRV